MQTVVAQAPKELLQAKPDRSAPSGGMPGSDQHCCDFGPAMRSFLTYLEQYREASPLTIQAYTRDLKRLQKFLQTNQLPTDVRKITNRQVQAFAISMSGLAAATITRALNAISSFFSYLARSGWVESNPVDGVIKPKQKRSFACGPTLQHCRCLVQATSNLTERAMIMLLLSAGLRRCELLNLRTSDVAADLSHVRIVGKGGRERVVPLPMQTQQVLQEYLDGIKPTPEFLFTNAGGKRMDNTTFYRIFNRIVKRAGLDQDGITPHSLRHAYATTLLHSAVDVKTVQELLGHANLSTTSRYLHSDQATKRAAAEALPDFLVGGDRSKNANQS